MVAIKDMEKPKNCIFCPLYVGKKGKGRCAITHKWNATGGLNRLDDCPLVEIGTCKDCKHWKDSDGVYRRGISAESKCLINNSRVLEGTFCCADFEKRGNEKWL